MLCIDFVNTVEPRIGPVRTDALANYAALAGWAGLPQLQAAGTERAFREALQLREALFDLFAALANGQPPAPAAIDTLRRQYAAACRAATWEITPEGTGWHWPVDEPRQLAWRIAVDAVDLANSGARIGQCPPEQGGCGWLFVDRTKNKSKRWCSMADCGNATKARRLAAKRKARRALKPPETAVKPG